MPMFRSSRDASGRAGFPWALVTALGTACSPKTGHAGSGGFPATGGGSADQKDASLTGSGSSGNGAGGTGNGGSSGFISIPDAVAPPADAELAADSGCEAVKDTRPDAPNVLILLDRSGSMYQPPVDRWDPAVAAISDLTSKLDAQVKFGLMEFPSPASTGVAGQCASGELIVPPALKTSSAIAGALSGDPTTKVAGGTPTAASLAGAQQALAALTGTSYVLLVTDGEPNCNASAKAANCTCTLDSPHDCSGTPTVDGGLGSAPLPIGCLDDDPTVAAITTLSNAGIHTFVVGYDASGFADVLNRMATAGGTARKTYFPVSDGSDLTTAFQSISSFVVSCTFELSKAPPDATFVSVSVDGHRVPRGAGWQLQGTREVALQGSTCDAVSDGKKHDILIVRGVHPHRRVAARRSRRSRGKVAALKQSGRRVLFSGQGDCNQHGIMRRSWNRLGWSAAALGMLAGCASGQDVNTSGDGADASAGGAVGSFGGSGGNGNGTSSSGGSSGAGSGASGGTGAGSGAGGNGNAGNGNGGNGNAGNANGNGGNGSAGSGNGNGGNGSAGSGNGNGLDGGTGASTGAGGGATSPDASAGSSGGSSNSGGSVVRRRQWRE